MILPCEFRGCGKFANHNIRRSTVKKFILDTSSANDFVKAWMLDGIANSCHKGETHNRLKAAEYLSEARSIRSSTEPNAEFSQSKLNRLQTRIAMHEEQQSSFQGWKDQAAAEWVKLTGNKSWKPYASGPSVTPMDQTAVNAFFDERLG